MKTFIKDITTTAVVLLFYAVGGLVMFAALAGCYFAIEWFFSLDDPFKSWVFVGLLMVVAYLSVVMQRVSR
jgi:hypothetical protein